MFFRRTLLSLVAGFLVQATSNHVIAEPDPEIAWLMKQELTLWDWGVITAREYAQRAAEDISSESSITYGGYAQYDLDANELHVWLTSGDYAKEFTPEACNNLRQQFLAHLVIRTSYPDYELMAAAVVGTWFEHPGGYRMSDRPADLGVRLAHITYVDVSLNNYAGSDPTAGIVCTGKITEIDSTSTMMGSKP